MSVTPALCRVPKMPSLRCQRSSADSDAARLCHLMEAAVAAAFAVPLAELRAPTRRSPGVAFARQSAMYLCHVVLGLDYTAIARSFGRDRTTAAHACRLVEERRDDPAIERMLGSLEGIGGLLVRGIAVNRGVVS